MKLGGQTSSVALIAAAIAASGCGSEPSSLSRAPSTPTRRAKTKLVAGATPSVAEAVPAPVEPACTAVTVELPELISSSIDVEVPPIVDPDGAMKRFYERAARILRGTAKDHVRIGVFGDSNMTMDWITGEIRRTLQQKHGDGGHGYVALGRPWNWYRHMDVKSGHLELDWKAFAVSTRPARDGAYGFAGIAARSERAGAVTWVATADDASPIGTRVSRMGVYYLKKPGAGAFEIRVDGEKKAAISTDSPSFEAGFHELDVPDAPHKLELASTTRTPVTLFGATKIRNATDVSLYYALILPGVLAVATVMLIALGDDYAEPSET